MPIYEANSDKMRVFDTGCQVEQKAVFLFTFDPLMFSKYIISMAELH